MLAGKLCSMEARPLHSAQAKEVFLAVVCIASAVWCVSCGGAGNTGVAPTAAAGFSLSSTSIEFANQSVGTASAPLSATLANNGNAGLDLSSIEVNGSNAGDFNLTNNCGSSLAPSGECTLTVTFKPSSSGTRTASIVFADNAAGSPQTVSLSGTGIAPAVSLSTTSLSFGSQAVAIASAAETFTLTNTGSAALSITNLSVVGANPGDFVEIANTCGGSVVAGSACTIGVTFTPSAGGERTANLSIADNAPGSPQTVSLSGAGSHDVILSWSASDMSENVAYNVYRGTTSGGEGSTPLNATPINGTTYVDESVAGGATYYYVLRAVGSNGELSAASTETEATVPAN
jgi:ASPM-SPD-2-Hydin domain-containing protein/centrosomal CEP192-like protein